MEGIICYSATVGTEPMALDYLDSPLRVETLSFEEAAGFIPQEWST